jgi:hypothetical protein
MAVTAKTADELVSKYGWTKNADGSVTSKSGNVTSQVIGRSVEVQNIEYNKDKTYAVVTYSDGSVAKGATPRAKGGNVYAEGRVEKDGFVVSDYSDRYKIITADQARAIKPDSIRPDVTGLVVWDAVNGKPQSSGLDSQKAQRTAGALNSFAHTAELSTATESAGNVKERGIPLQVSPKLDMPAPTMPGYYTAPPAGVQPSTQVQQVPAGQVATVSPSTPQTAVQQIAPITYQQAVPQVQTQQATTGTMGVPLQTAGLSAVPQQVTYKTHYAGTQGAVPQTLVSSMPGYGPNIEFGTKDVTYVNETTGQTISVTEYNGMPMTYVPPGFVRGSAAPAQQQQAAQTTQDQVSQEARAFGTALGSGAIQTALGMAKGGMMNSGYAEGGSAGNTQTEALYSIAKLNGYKGPKSGTALKSFFNSSDALKAKARAIGVAMNKGGAVLYAQEGVDVQEGQEDQTTKDASAVDTQPGVTMGPTFSQDLAGQTKSLIGQTMQPIQSNVAMIQPNAADFIPVDAGQTVPMAPYAEAATVGTVQQAAMPTAMAPATAGVTTAAPQVQEQTDALQAAQGTVSQGAQVTAAQQEESSVTGLQAAQGTATMVNAPAAREIQDGEIISAAANAEKAALFTEQIQAAEATPSKQATVQGQLETLMQQFEGGNTPAWAAGAMRNAMGNLAARGLGASSLAGQAVIQAAMESALPIAQMDAQTQAQFESQNLSNRQQRAMLAAQQRAEFLGMEFTQEFQARVQNSARIGDIANMNFTSEQQIALENSRAANTMNIANLNNQQAMVMAEAAALANLDMANLNNRQQAAVQNANSFLQMDMANLSNQQQTAMFKAQQNIQALFSDQAAENAAAQFNAQSENQTNQFFANLSSQTSQFNAAQQNAMDQFNVNSVNALREFNSGLQQQRDMFNAQNGLVIAQANAQWRQNIATLNSAAQNQSNMDFAKTINSLTSTNLDAYWQRERDVMSFAFTSAENAADRMASVLLEKLSAENKARLADEMGKGSLVATLVKGGLNYMAGKTIV